MSKRLDWTFQFSQTELRDATAKKIAFHEERVAYWEAERDMAEEDLKANGISIRDAVDMSPASNVTRFQPEPQIDPTKLKRVRESDGKLKEHETKLADYRRWAFVFRPTPRSGVLDLTIDDVAYFGLIDQEALDS